MRRWLACLLAVLLVLQTAAAQAAGKLVGYITIDGVRRSILKQDDWWYYETEAGITLYQYSGKDTDLVLPGEFDGVPVVNASTWAVPTGVVSVTIPGSFQRVPDRLLYNRKKLTRVVFQEGVVHIGEMACWSCSLLSHVTLPSTLQSVGDKAFYGTGITALTLGSAGGLSLGAEAFSGCNSLSRLTLDGMETLSRGAFAYCRALTSVTLGSSVRTVGDEAFMGCPLLTSVTLGSGVTGIGADAFNGTGVTHIALPAGLKTLGARALLASSLESVDIPDSVTALSLPLVDKNTVMIVGKNSAALAAIQAEGLLNWRLRGEVFVPGTGGTPVTLPEKVADVVATVVKPGMTDYEKALALHDFLVVNAQYDITHNEPDTYEADGVLMRGAGVCQAYTDAYSLLLDAVGIPNMMELGTDHIWNLVYLDGEWTHIDVTWDDPLGSGQGSSLESGTQSGRETHTYFGLTNEALEGVSAHECELVQQLATGYRNSYAHKAGALTKHVNAITQVIKTRLAKGERDFTFVPSTFGANDLRNNYGINERMSLAVVRDQTFPVGGTDYGVDLVYDNSTRKLTVHAYPVVAKPETAAGSLTAAPGDVFCLSPDRLWKSEDPAVASVLENRVTVKTAGTVRLLGEGSADIAVVTLRGADLATLWVEARTVGEESFSGTAAQRVEIGEETRSLGASAFAAMPRLALVVFRGQTTVGEGCFSGAPEGLAIIAPAGSPAAAWADAAGIPWYPAP